MEHALIIGASGGIGAALAEHLARPTRHRLCRSADGLDVTDPASVAAALGGSTAPSTSPSSPPASSPPTGHAPEKSLDAIDADAMARTFAVNAIGPALILKHLAPLLADTARVGVLTARVGSIGDNRMGGWYSYRAAKAAANQIVHGAAIEIGRKRKGTVVVALHPGTVETSFTEGYKAPKVAAAEAAENLTDVLTGPLARRHRRLLRLRGQAHRMVGRLILVLGDQLSDDLSALREGRQGRDTVVMAEVQAETDYVPHHPRKIAFLFAAMRKYAARLRADGWTVRYTRLDDPDNTQSIPGELLRAAAATGAQEAIGTEPGEFRLIAALEDVADPRPPVSRRPVPVLPRRVRGLGRGAQGVAHGVVLPRDAPQDRPDDGGRQARGRQVELRPRQPQAAPRAWTSRRPDALRPRRDGGGGAGPGPRPLRQPLRQCSTTSGSPPTASRRAARSRISSRPPCRPSATTRTRWSRASPSCSTPCSRPTSTRACWAGARSARRRRRRGRTATCPSTRPRASSGRSSAGANTSAASTSARGRTTRRATRWAPPATCRSSTGPATPTCPACREAIGPRWPRPTPTTSSA